MGLTFVPHCAEAESQLVVVEILGRLAHRFLQHRGNMNETDVNEAVIVGSPALPALTYEAH